MDGNDLHAQHAGAGRVGAVGGIGDEHFIALAVSTGLVVGLHHQHAGKLAMGAGSGLQGNGGKTADLLQPLLHLPHQRQGTLDGLDGLHGVDVQKAGKAAGVFVDLGVVLHGAAAQRVKAFIYAVVVAA